MLSQPDHVVRHFRDVLVWPVQIRPGFSGGEIGRLHELITGDGRWAPVDDEFTTDPADFQERHYKEFVAFLPYVQRFLYGDSRSGVAAEAARPASMSVYRRTDVAGLRVTLRPGEAPIALRVAHVDLYLFLDMDVALLNVEVAADDLPLATALELLYRFGRAYPTGWDANGQGVHNVHRSELLGHDGQILATSDSEQRDRYLHFVCAKRAPRVGALWAWLLQPLVQDQEDLPGALRYRLIEYYRMPMMAFLALDDPRALTREDFIRIGFVANLPARDPLPVRDPSVLRFERLHCEDRFWTDSEEGPNSRFLCTGNALVLVGDARSEYFRDPDHGFLARFRHQYFLVFMIAHFHRAALLSFSDGLADAVNDLDVRDAESVRRFKRRIRLSFEAFLRFTHRYWFHEVSEQGLVQALFQRTTGLLRNDELFADVKEQVREMSAYLDSDSQRRQSGTVLRLTVVTIFGLIATVVTGYFGMNLFNFPEVADSRKLLQFGVVTGSTLCMVLFAVARSKRLSDFLEALSDERLDGKAKWASLVRVFRKADESR
ncbi:CorA family divalent cation transporter [Zoogloea dura]|uniref:CorA-like Mg2+ transporter protein n=1 Tax=Zoogloea dura TaxID=2728840 RepID=A0A848FZH0_9RHOO|nr:CorA family divalent cation transporter [Zoogloea dura]NML24474.1 hypothetical protein [Zoogloea dura]